MNRCQKHGGPGAQYQETDWICSANMSSSRSQQNKFIPEEKNNTKTQFAHLCIQEPNAGSQRSKYSQCCPQIHKT